jgi:hypothetical protein
MLGISGASVCFGQPQNPCFAFLVRGDVSVVCNNRTVQITKRGDVEGFAASNEAFRFAFTTSRITKRTEIEAWRVYTTTLINLNSGGSEAVEKTMNLLNTCGGIFPVGGARGLHSSARDLISGDELSFQPYVRFRCSSDRKKVVGTTKDQGGDLYAGTPPTIKVAAAGQFDVFRFNISPDGSKIAYYNGRLCLFSSPGVAQCTEAKDSLSDEPSVDDSGEVLVSVGTGQECYYKSFANFSRERFPDAADGDKDECSGIGYWKPGLNAVKTIESLGRSPQWISPTTAELMRKWSVHQNMSTPK